MSPKVRRIRLGAITAVLSILLGIVIVTGWVRGNVVLEERWDYAQGSRLSWLRTRSINGWQYTTVASSNRLQDTYRYEDRPVPVPTSWYPQLHGGRTNTRYRWYLSWKSTPQTQITLRTLTR